MKRLILGLLAALFVHLVILVFGGIFFLDSGDEKKALAVEDIDVVDTEQAKEEKKPEELEKRKADEVEAPPEKAPDMQQLVQIENEWSVFEAAITRIQAT